MTKKWTLGRPGCACHPEMCCCAGHGLYGPDDDFVAAFQCEATAKYLCKAMNEREELRTENAALQVEKERDALQANLSEQPTVPDGWLRAVDEEMTRSHLGVAFAADSYAVAKKKLADLIKWHVTVATDPVVNGGFKLVPVEPTPEMKAAGQATIHRLANDGIRRHWQDVYGEGYEAMIAAAPTLKGETSE